MNNRAVIGLDLGHSAVKMTFDGRHGVEREIFSSHVCRAGNIESAEEAYFFKQNLVEVNNKLFFVGDASRLHCEAHQSGLNASWIYSEEYAALIAMAKRIADDRAAYGERLWVIGLPLTQFNSRKKEIINLAKKYLEDDAEIYVIPKVLGGCYAHSLNRKGELARGTATNEESWGFIDIGYYKADFSLIREGRNIIRAQGSCDGLYLVVEALQQLLIENHKIDCSMLDAERALHQGYIKHYRQRILIEQEIRIAKQDFENQIAHMALRLMDYIAASLDGVLLTGGGAGIVLDAIYRHWPHTKIIQDTHENMKMNSSRYITSEGYYRYGRSITLKIREKQIKQIIENLNSRN